MDIDTFHGLKVKSQTASLRLLYYSCCIFCYACSIFGKVKQSLFLLFLLLSCTLSAQQYNFHNYSVKDGIAQSQVYCMLQDSRGYLWLGTRGGGLTRFDGLSFKTFTTKDGLANNYILCLREDSQHNLWIGTDNGLSFYNGLMFKNYSPEQSTSADMKEIDFDGEGHLWIASSEGLLKFDGRRFVNMSQLVNDHQHVINTVLVLNPQTILYANANGLFNLHKNGTAYTYTLNKQYPQINCIRKDRTGTIWLGTYGTGVFTGDGEQFTQLKSNATLQSSIVWNINFDKKNHAWISTLTNGVIGYDLQNDTYNFLTEQEGLSNNHVRCMLQDHSGNFWFGTSGGGVSNYFGKMFTHYDKGNGLGGNFVYSIFKDSKNRTWIGTADKGLTVLDHSGFSTINASKGFADVKVKAIGEDNFGNLYFGTDGFGLYIYHDSLFENIGKLQSQYIKSIVKDHDGIMWVAAAGNGIYKIEPTKSSKGNNLVISNLNEGSGLLQNRITVLHCDKRNRIWYGTENAGVGCIGSADAINSKDGMPSDAIRSFAEDSLGVLWVGTAGDGIAALPIYDEKMVVENSFRDQLTSNNIYLMAFDAKSNLLVGSESGIDYVVFNKERSISEVKHYSKGDGFTGIETCQNAVCDNGDGTFWFGTINGLTKYNPSNLVKNENEAITVINDVRLYYISLIKTKFKKFVGDWNAVQYLELPYNQNHLSFDFMGINFSNPDAVRYKWKLEGFDEEWSPVSSQRTVTYSNIPSGHFIFKVMSCNENGVWNKIPATLKIYVRKPFWFEWWFIIAGSAAFVAGVWIVFKQRERSIKQKASEQQQKLILEKELIELEHKALRLQMNPHFIFNALNSIQSQIGTDNEQNARYYLAKFSKLMRQILDNSRSSTISLQDEIRMLENYLLVEKFCNSDTFDYKIELQEGLETDYIKIPPMILQPFVENAIKHGMKYLQSKQGFILVKFKEAAHHLVCTVTDNGVGRRKSEELNKQSREAFHKSTALAVTEERLNLLHEGSVAGHIVITDLYDDTGNASGTKVEVRIPIR